MKEEMEAFKRRWLELSGLTELIFASYLAIEKRDELEKILEGTDGI